MADEAGAGKDSGPERKQHSGTRGLLSRDSEGRMTKTIHYCRYCGVNTRSAHMRTCGHCLSVQNFLTDIGSGRMRAGSAVACAINRGDLARATEFVCACGKPAEQYDHRDYNRPLEVEPVCRSCNVRRGSAIPLAWDAKEWRKYIRAKVKSYRSKHYFALAKIVFPVSFGIAPPRQAKRIAHRKAA